MKGLSLVLAAGALIATTAFAFAGPAGDGYYRDWRAMGEPAFAHHAADGGYRCHGVSYGTGAQSCGTMTGGPVGGLNSRN